MPTWAAPQNLSCVPNAGVLRYHPAAHHEAAYLSQSSDLSKGIL